MYPISSAIKAIFDAEQTQVLRITGTDKNGVAISITEENVMENGFNIDRFSCNGNKLEIGTACSAELTLKLDNRQGQFNSIVFEGTELFVEIGIADWSQTNPTVTYIPCGYFTCDEQPRSLSTITVKALDRMTKFDVVPPILVPWVTAAGDAITDSQGNPLYFASNARFPITVANLVQRIAHLCDVPFDQSLTSFPNYNYTITELPNLQQQITFRNMIQWCAGLMGTCAFIDWDGYLVFKWYSAASYTSTMSMRYSSDLQESDITITGVAYTNTQNITIVSGTDDYALDMTGNYLMANDVATILPNVKNAVNGFTYRPFTASVINAPYLWPLDVITFTDKDGNDHNCAVTNVNFGLNSTTSLAGKGESSQANKGTGASGVTKETSLLIEGATEFAAQKAMDNATQEQIFNKLTNNGEAQGLLLYNGNVYLNASYINTGTLSANYIKGGTLTLGGNNNVNGSLQILDANGNVIGKWDKDGITLNKGTIAGPSVTLGGTDNQNGLLQILGDDGTPIGKWDKSGIRATGVTLNSATVAGNITSRSYNTIGHLGTVQIVIDDGYITFSADGSTSLGTAIITPYYNVGSLGLRIEASETMVYNLWAVNNAVFAGDITASQDVNVTGDLTLDGDVVGDLWVDGGLTVTGTKSRSVETSQYSDRLLYCYETPSPFFGDIGEGVIGDDGLCYISIDPIFAKTITTSHYQVFLQKYGYGDIWVKERTGAYFIVEGTIGMKFGWEIKAKQSGYDQKRLELAEKKFTPPQSTYGADAAQYIEDLKKERIS